MQSSFEILCTTLRRCRVPGMIGMYPANCDEVQSRTETGLRILQGLLGQVEGGRERTVQQIEQLFMNMRLKWARTQKLKRQKLKKVQALLQNEDIEEEFRAYTKKRVEAFRMHAEGEKEKEREILESMHALVGDSPKIRQALIRHEVSVAKPAPAQLEHTHRTLDLVFPNEEMLAQFKSGQHSTILSHRKSYDDFETMLVFTVCVIEQFLAKYEALSAEREKKNTPKTCRNVLRFVAQWPAMFSSAYLFFQENYISLEYLVDINSRVSEEFPHEVSVPLAPVTYDIAEQYIWNSPVASPSALSLAESLQKMRI